MCFVLDADSSFSGCVFSKMAKTANISCLLVFVDSFLLLLQKKSAVDNEQSASIAKNGC
jgi:hypothetical protein